MAPESVGNGIREPMDSVTQEMILQQEFSGNMALISVPVVFG